MNLNNINPQFTLSKANNEIHSGLVFKTKKNFCSLSNLYKKITGVASSILNGLSVQYYGFFNFIEHKVTHCNGIYLPIVQVPIFNQNHVFITDPKIIKLILSHERNQTGENALFDGGIPSKVAKQILGDCLLCYPDVIHSHVRKIIAPHLTSVVSFSENLYAICKNGIKNNISLSELVIEAILKCYLNYTGNDSKKIANSVENLLQLASKKRNSGEEKNYHQTLLFINETAHQIAESLRDNAQLSKLSKDELIAFIKIMFFAGQDTTSSLLKFFLITLGQKEFHYLQDDLYREALTYSSPIDFALNSVQLDDLFYEGLRLHPASLQQSRQTVTDIYIAGELIPKNSILYLSHLYGQRDKRKWGDDANLFNPKRFTNTNLKQTLLAYSTGPTGCLGKQFSINLIKIYLSTLIHQYRWDSLTKIERLDGLVSLEIYPSPKFQYVERN